MTSPASALYRPQTVARQVQLHGAPLASFSARAGALVVDGLLVAAVILVPTLLWTAFMQAPTGKVTFTLDFGAVASFALAVLYFSLSTYFGNGVTLGKRLFGIRVVSLLHPRLTLWHAIERALGYAASSLEAGFGFLQYFTHPNRQTVHDRIAETIVVKDRRPRTPRSVDSAQRVP